MNTQLLPIGRSGIVPLLIMVQAVILFPLWFYMPLWISVVTIMLLGVKYLSYRYHLNIPYWLILVCVISALAGVYLQFKTISGRDAGIGLISMMYSFKLLEAKNYRDAALILFISFFMLVTAFLFNESIFMGAYLLVAVATILGALVALNSLSGIDGLKKVSSLSGIALLQALPLMLVLFFLFPRLSGPLWAIPSTNTAGTGIDDTMSPGDIGALHAFDDIAFRVDFTGQAPQSGEMYWRGLVFSDFDGYTWKEGQRHSIRPESLPKTTATYDYKIQLEPSNRRWLFGLEQVAIPPKRVFLFNDNTWRKPQKVTQRFIYEAQAYHIDYSQVVLSDLERSSNLALPDVGNQKTKQWASSLYQRVNDPETYVRVILTEIRNNNYRYTLTPEILEDEVIDDFWLGTREGFCEHYASAFVFIMRAAGIPARVVTGYQGGEYNPYGDYFIVRQSDAHAWSEVWIQGKGWLRVDPTAAIHPSRVDSSLQRETSMRDDWLEGFNPTVDFELPDGLFSNLALRWDALQSFWNETLMGYDQDMQFDWLASLGITNDRWRYLSYFIIVSLILSFSIFGFIILKKSRNSDLIEIYFNKLQKKLEKKGFYLQSSEGPNALFERLKKEDPHLAQALQPLIKQYIYLRYQARHVSKKSVNRFVKMVKDF